MGKRMSITGAWASSGASRRVPGAVGRWSPAGFTLVEMMVVVTVAGILVSLAQPSFTQSVIKAREAALKQNLFTLRDVLDQYRADRGQYPPTLDELKTAGYLKRIPLDPFTKSEATWQLILDQTDGGVFDVHSGSDLVGLDGTAYNEW